jgi:glucokinase
MTSTGVRAAVGADGAHAARRSAVLAFDIGGTKLAAGVVDVVGTVHAFDVEPTEADRGPDAAVARLFDLGRRVVDASGVPWDEILAVGICCGGPLDRERGVLLGPLHLPGWEGLPLTALAGDAFQRPATLENDATAAALGEQRYGAGAGARDVVYLTLSTGVGGGVVLGGRLFRGSTGNGGELGHVTVDWRGRPCRGCGRNGCLEAYVSGTSIAERAREAGLDAATAADVAAAARNRDPTAVRVWDETVEALACGIVSLVNVFEPELVVLGGGVMRSGQLLLAPLRERVQRSAVGPAAAARVVQAALGDHVGVVGAAATAFDAIETGVVVPHG